MRIGVGLSIPELATRGGRAFSPASLFTSGVQGAWYDPSDYNTLFQDSAGTTPVTAVEQPVGLMLDKSQGLALGSELVTPIANSDFSSDTGFWQKDPGITISGGACNYTSIVNNGYALYKLNFLTASKYYEVTWTITAISGGALQVYAGGSFGPARTSPGTYTERLTMGTVNNVFNIRTTSVTTLNASIDNVSVKELAGNHASQATPTSRPVLRARYNLLTYSEQFDNAAWAKTATTVSANQTTAPDGTTTADTLTESGTAGEHYINQQTTKVGASIRYTYRVAFKNASGTRNFAISLTDGTTGGYGAIFSTSGTVVSSSFVIGSVSGWTFHSSDVVADANGFYVATLSVTTNTATRFDAVCYLVNGTTTSYTGNGTSAIYIWGADLRTGSSAGTYQRIAAATDYATAGFLPYLDLITDDNLATGSIDFTATDAMSVLAGITKNSDAATAMLIELSADANSNNGSFYFTAPISASANYQIVSKGTVSTSAGYTNAAIAAPVTNVVGLISKISTPSLALRVNGTQVSQSTATQGTGNFGNLPLYIGRRGGSSFPFNGRIYQMIVCGKTLSASELASTEAFVNTKTGAY